jgi:hypothetical protein
MTAKWGSCIILATCLAVMVGCRTPQPVLKPDKEPEQLVSPPPGSRYDTPAYPKQAFDKPEDPGMRAMDAKNGMMPTRGSMLPGAGTMGGLPGRN